MKLKCTQTDDEFVKGNAFLIGENYLLIKCSELLLKNHFKIIGIVSTKASVKEWAISHQIPIFQSLEKAETILKYKSIDYLFSVVNSKIISKTLLEKVKKLAVNYHNAPLPRYAGVNASSWAILNHESEHGVTWHELNEQIDAGDILKQVVFKIKEDETASTLNHQCYHHALVLLKELIDDINENKLCRLPQDKSKRTYFSLTTKPMNNGLIDWTLSAEELLCQFRALSFGIYENTLSALKIKLQNSAYLVTELEMSQQSSLLKPGTLVEVNPAFWRVATATKDLILLKINNLYGEACPLPSLLNLHQIQVGASFQLKAPTDFNEFYSYSLELSKYEAFWVNQFLHFEPIQFPFSPTSILEQQSSYQLIHFYPLDDSLLLKIKKEDHTLEEVLITLWCIYLYRMGNKNNLGLGLAYSELKQTIEFDSSKPFFAQTLPFFVQLNQEDNFDKALKTIAQQLSLVKSKKTFLKDIFYRYPSLAESVPNAPISFVIENSAPMDINDFNSGVLLKISLLHQRLEWHVKASKVNPNLKHMLIQSIQHVNIMTKSLAQNPSQALSKLPLLSSEERDLILYGWNDTATVFSHDKNVGLLIEASFKKHAHNPALQFNHTTLTYEALEDKVDALIHYFLQNNIKAQDAIIVYLAAGPEWVISLLAILKYGAIYIPIADKSSIPRLKLIAQDSKTRLILTNAGFKEDLKQSCSIPTLDVVAFLEQDLRVPPVTAPSFSNQWIAYLLYTSDTTEGLMIRHQSLVNLIEEQARRLKIDAQSKVLQFAAIDFDVSLWEVFAAFNQGATLHIPMEKNILFGKKLTETLNQAQISFATLQPSILQTLDPLELKTLKTLVSTGEACSRELADKWVDHVYFINAYGSPETTIFATIGVINKALEVNIGKPIANTQAYVLDEDLNPLPVGFAGELYLGGYALAMDYLNKPQLTKKYFLPNPFSQESNRLYKTRNLVRWLRDGTLEYLGRIDHQIRVETEFIANRSHDLRTPLVGMIGMLQLMKEKIDNPELPQYAFWVNESGKQLLSLLNGILEVLSPEVDDSDIVHKPFDLYRCIRDIAIKSGPNQTPEYLGFNHFEQNRKTEDESSLSEQPPHINLSRPPSLLLVEDNSLALKMLQIVVTHAGCNYESAENAQIALKLAKEKTFDLIITDIGLPSMSGQELTLTIRKWEDLLGLKKTPIVGLTAHIGEAETQKCLEAGMDKVLIKPATFKLIHSLILEFVQVNYLEKLNEERHGAEDLNEFSTYPLLDVNKGIGILGNESVFKEMVELMVEQGFEEDQIKIKAAHTEKNWSKVQALAHKIKGGAAYCGMVQLQMICEHLEKTRQEEQALSLDTKFKQLMHILDSTKQEAENWLKQNCYTN